ncbi:hypothetical protein HR12_30915 [Microbacterium sp. SUBG005]|nr:hypothetical protein HR12_30915 [Microbacterium sp. SUBG005]
MSHPDVIALATMILRRCVVICLAASTFTEAFRLFTVVNDRGLQLRRVDIIKSNCLAPEVIFDDAIRAHYAAKWESIEDQVGPSTFEDIFHSLRLIYTQDKPKEDLLGEFEHRVFGQPKKPKKGTNFIDTLGKYVDLYDALFIAKDFLDGTEQSAKFTTMMSAMVDHFCRERVARSRIRVR